MRNHAVNLDAENQHGRNAIEEYVLENSCLNLCPIELTKHYPMQKAPKLKTVSIIDTLSELARGETDREDNGNVFLPVNNLSLLPEIRSQRLSQCPCQQQVTTSRLKSCERNRKELEALRNNYNINYKTRNRNYSVKPSHIDNVHAAWTPKSWDCGPIFAPNHVHREKCLGFSQTGLGKSSAFSSSNHHSATKARNSDFHSRLPYLAFRYTTDPKSSTLYENKSEMARHRWGSVSRHCFSDSEIDGFDLDSVTISKSKARSKCTSEDCLDTRLAPDYTEYLKGKNRVRKQSDRSGYDSEKSSSKMSVRQVKNKVKQSNYKKNKMPEWISSIFKIAKEGKLEKLKMSLKDMDSALVRNLSDCNGNNLWHIASNYNHLSCVQWLCTQFGQVALMDENKHGLTPVVSAVKRGSLAVIQWLLSKKFDQGYGHPSEGKRSLLHFAAKYGQVEVVKWLTNHMTGLGFDLNIKDADGNTALHLAAKYGHIQSVKIITLDGGDLTLRNNFGHKPYDLSTINRQPACSEYLVALEACLSLSTGSFLLESDLQRFQVDNMSMRKNFKELQQLMRTSIFHQKELLETFYALCRESQLLEQEANEQSAESEKGEEQSVIRQGFQNRLKEEFDKWYRNALLKDEANFHLLEDKWKHQHRRNSKHTLDNKSPLNIVRSQFAQVFAKANSSNLVTDINITSDSSLSEDSSDDEPDSHSSVHPLSQTTMLPQFLEEIHLNEMLSSPSSFPMRQATNKHSTLSNTSSYSAIKRRVASASRLPTNHNRRTSLPAHHQFDTNLRTLFERNPELKQEGQTCTVLEVLEPSSSENEDAPHQDKSSVKLSKSSNSLNDFLSDSHKASPSANLSEDCQGRTSTKRINSKENGSGNAALQKNLRPAKMKESFSLEPTLKMVMAKAGEGLVQSSREGRQKTRTMDVNRTLNEKNLHGDIQRFAKTVDENCVQESERNSGSTENTSEVADSVENILESSPKKRGFLLKFSLKNRWSSKQKRSSKKMEKVIDETKADVQNLSSSSRVTTTGYLSDAPPPSEEIKPLFLTVAEPAFPQPQNCDRIVPKRREPPPPIPDICSEPLDGAMDHGFPPESADCLSNISLSKSPHLSSREDLENQQFCSSPDDMSRLYCSTTKSDSRPPSSASRIDTTLRSEDGFKVVGLPLRKTLSASTELLVSLDSSTAGRQSPAHSEVSKTESALSPPSDVSKTESTRHLNQLGKIEEQRANAQKPVEMKQVTIVDLVHIEESSECSNKRCFEKPLIGETMEECRKSDKKSEPSSKPWYEVSDDEDLLGPGRFRRTVQSNSEDEASEMML